MALTGQSVLSAEILARCAERAAIYDRDNRFFSEDFAELRAARYLLNGFWRTAVPGSRTP